MRLRKRVCGKKLDPFRKKLFKNLKIIFKFVKNINVLSFKGTALINPLVPLIYNFVFDDANRTYWQMNSQKPITRSPHTNFYLSQPCNVSFYFEN